MSHGILNHSYNLFRVLWSVFAAGYLFCTTAQAPAMVQEWPKHIQQGPFPASALYSPDGFLAIYYN